MLTADSNGEITGKFTIPANMPVGSKEVVARGQGGSEGRAIFVGSGVIETRILRQLFTRTVIRWIRFDPLAQTFSVFEDRHITSVEVQFGVIGDRNKPVVCQVRTVELGLPTQEIVTETVLDMNNVNVNEWTKFSFNNPALLTGEQTYALVFLTDDAEHSVCVAELGKFDAMKQKWVSSQPYQVGELLSSSNAETWTTHPERDLMMRINGAKFTATQREIDAGDLALSNVSELVVSAQTEIPNINTSIEVHVTRADGSVIKTSPDQTISFDEYLNETVNIKFVLNGTEHVSPTLYPIIQYIMGELKPTGDYITRALPADSGNPMNVVIAFDSLLPVGGSDAVVEVGQDGNWQATTLHQTTPLGDGWQEKVFKLDNYQDADARVRVTLSGNPASRPHIRNFRANVTPDPVNVTGTPELAAA